MVSKLTSLCDTVLSSSSVFMTSKTPSGIKDIMKVLKQKVAKLLKLVFFVIPSSGVVQNCLTHSHNGNVTFYNEQCTTPSFFTTSLETIHSRTMASTKSNITQDCRFRNKVCAWRLNWLSNCRLSA